MIEGTWFHAKRHCKRGQGNVRTDSDSLSIALYEFMWFKKPGLTRDQRDAVKLPQNCQKVVTKLLYNCHKVAIRSATKLPYSCHKVAIKLP